jgi:hypothetical protein
MIEVLLVASYIDVVAFRRGGVDLTSSSRI